MRHFWLRDANQHPVACIASTLQPDSTIAFAVAITNPKDVFNRKMGRQIAEGRLNNPKRTGLYYIMDRQTPVKHAIMGVIYEATLTLPKRVRDAAKLWLTAHPLDLSRPNVRRDHDPSHIMEASPSGTERREMPLHGPDTITLEVPAPTANQSIAVSVEPEPLTFAAAEPTVDPFEPVSPAPDTEVSQSLAETIAALDERAAEQTPEPEIEISASQADAEKLNRIFTGVHTREEQPFRFSDAPTESEAWRDES